VEERATALLRQIRCNGETPGREYVSRLHIDKNMSQPAGCTPPRPENRPGEAGEPGTPLAKKSIKII
jgi:hypothetical protein